MKSPTEEGIVMHTNDEHFLKAFLPIDLMEEGIVNSVNDEQL